MSGILGADWRAILAERVELEKKSRFNPLRNWTPDVLERQLDQYSRGEIAPLTWVMEWLEKHDDTIATVASKAKAAVSRHGYDVVFSEGLPNEKKQAAEEQREYVEEFYANIETSDALNPDESGGMRLLVHQVMDAHGKKFAAHHIIWQPSKDGLRAKLVKVPTWLFEATEGRLKFLPDMDAPRGVELETLGGRVAWMVSQGRGVMLAGVIAAMYKRIPLQDLLTYWDRHGMPIFLGKTNAAKGTDGWNQMSSVVASMGAEYGAVINNNGDTIKTISLAGGDHDARQPLPYAGLIERMDRAQVMLWRGGDLSTMSRTNGRGANLQQDETDGLDADNAAWVSETLNANLTRRVVKYRFGEDAPLLVKVRLRTKTRASVTKELAIVESARELGFRFDKGWFVSRFGITEADKDEAALGDEEVPSDQSAVSSKEADASNHQILQPKSNPV